MSPANLHAETLTDFVTRIFQAVRVPLEAARIVAEHLVEAELCGVTSHGLLRVAQYVRALDEGKIKPDASLTVTTETAGTAALDGHHGFGQVMARRAMDVTIEKARRTGVGAVTLVNCSHTGRLASYTVQAARQGMVGMMMVNAGGHGQWMSPYGGTSGRLATNPVSFAVPAGDDAPLVLDIATSAAPEGKIRALLTAGRALPPGWVIDHKGQPTTNPGDLYGPPRGALLPFGGHKGFGLAMMVEALAGGLSGAGVCHRTDAPLEGKTDGVFLLAVEVQAFCGLPQFAQQMSQLIAHVASSPPAPGVKQVLAPGALEAQTRQQRLREGVPVDPHVWQALTQLSDRWDVPLP